MYRPLLCALLCLIFHCGAWGLPPEWQAWQPELTRQEDFHQFWSRSSYQSALARMPAGNVLGPLSVLTLGRKPLSSAQFTQWQEATLAVPILHLTDWWADDSYIGPLEGKLTLHLTLLPNSSPGRGWTAEGLVDAWSLPLHDAVLTARQALRVLLSQPEVNTPRVGIVGEGLGGAVAVALAALEPEIVQFIAIHQPVPGFHFLKPGVAADSDVVLQPVRQMASTGRVNNERLIAVMSYFDFFNFAPDVRRRALVSMSINDPVATPEQVLSIYNHLQSPKQLVVQDFRGHLTTSSRNDFYHRTHEWLQGLGWARKATSAPRTMPTPHNVDVVR